MSNEGRIAKLVHIGEGEDVYSLPRNRTVLSNSVLARLLDTAEGTVPNPLSAARLERLELLTYRTREWLDALLAAEIMFTGPKAAEIRHRAQELRRMFDNG